MIRVLMQWYIALHDHSVSMIRGYNRSPRLSELFIYRRWAGKFCRRASDFLGPTCLWVSTWKIYLSAPDVLKILIFFRHFKILARGKEKGMLQRISYLLPGRLWVEVLIAQPFIFDYFTYAFLVAKPFYGYQNFWPWILTYFSETLTLDIT